MVSRDDAEIHFGKADTEKVQINESVQKGLGTAYIWVSDIDQLFDELSRKDVEILRPGERIYESIEVVIKDCNGFQLVFAV